jgi:hypothetical protein
MWTFQNVKNKSPNHIFTLFEPKCEKNLGNELKVNVF